jgi:hypothetical protein
VDARYQIQRVLNRVGYRVKRAIPTDLDARTVETIRRVKPFAKTTPRLSARSARRSSTS